MSHREEAEQQKLIELYSDGEGETLVRMKKASPFFTVASMVVPDARLPFIQAVYGSEENIMDNSCGLIKCLSEVVQLVIDEKQEVIKLFIPDWKDLEDEHLKSVS